MLVFFLLAALTDLHFCKFHKPNKNNASKQRKAEANFNKPVCPKLKIFTQTDAATTALRNCYLSFKLKLALRKLR